MLEKKKKFSIKTKHPLILASSSIIRKSILKNAGLDFKTISSNINEGNIKKSSKISPILLLARNCHKRKQLQ